MIQLRVRTEYSFGQTFAPISRVIARLKEQGCTAAGIVDGSTWGHVRWHAACLESGIQPLLGIELVVADEELAQRMWFLAKSPAGLSELYRASSNAHLQPFSAQRGTFPRLYRADVLAMSDEILKFAGDVLDGDFLAAAGAVVDLSPASRLLNMKKRRLAEEQGLLLVGVSDNFFSTPEDKTVFELVARNAMKPSPMHLLDASDLEGQEIAQLIAEECPTYSMPQAPLIRVQGNLEAVCRAGIEFRGMAWTEEYEARLQYELQLIRSKDFESYFLMVADMCDYAKEHMLVGPSRGSAAGSLVCYTARITEIDPMPAKLYFERFIDVSRSDLPDIDLDFPDDKRAMVFEYMAAKYGVGKTAKIGSINKYAPKSALIEVCKSLGIPPAATFAVKTAMLVRSSADSRANNCLEDTFNETEPGKAFIRQFPQAVAAGVIEGHASHTGVHAAGLLVCNDFITSYCTVDANGIAHVEKGAAESLGLLKVDVLGLKTLGILEDSGIEVDWYHLPFDDPKTYDVFNRGALCGIFQFEGNALRAIARRTKFKSLREIDAVTALARPGPFGGGVTEEYVKRSQGKPYRAIHPLVEPHMSETYGLPVYQEQTLAIVREIGRFDWKETSTIRKAMSKRMGKEFFDTYWEKFRIGAASQGIDTESARVIWELINSMGAWQMNKAHTYSYAVISYWTAWLKAHHPLEFAASNLRRANDEDNAIELLREMVKEGMHYVPFDINLSEETWSVKDGKLVAGFNALKGVGDVKASKLVELRNAGKLTAKQVADIGAAQNVYADIFPITTRYKHLYEDPESQGVAGPVLRIEQIDEITGSHVFLGSIVSKNGRNANEDVNVKRRDGKRLTGPLEFLDLRIRDDTGTIGARIGRHDYMRMGKAVLEEWPVGSDVLIRADFLRSKAGEAMRYAFIKNIKRLDAAT